MLSVSRLEVIDMHRFHSVDKKRENSEWLWGDRQSPPLVHGLLTNMDFVANNLMVIVGHFVEENVLYTHNMKTMTTAIAFMYVIPTIIFASSVSYHMVCQWWCRREHDCYTIFTSIKRSENSSCIDQDPKSPMHSRSRFVMSHYTMMVHVDMIGDRYMDYPKLKVYIKWFFTIWYVLFEIVKIRL